MMICEEHPVPRNCISEGSLVHVLFTPFTSDQNWSARPVHFQSLSQDKERKHHYSQSEKKVKTYKAHAFRRVPRGMETIGSRRLWNLELVSRQLFEFCSISDFRSAIHAFPIPGLFFYIWLTFLKGQDSSC